MRLSIKYEGKKGLNQLDISVIATEIYRLKHILKCQNVDSDDENLFKMRLWIDKVQKTQPHTIKLLTDK